MDNSFIYFFHCLCRHALTDADFDPKNTSSVAYALIQKIGKEYDCSTCGFGMGFEPETDPKKTWARWVCLECLKPPSKVPKVLVLYIKYINGNARELYFYIEH